ncbi:MAG: flavodoxin-dependent (E)-4-hydroxy-3-methylbut-2-enyl-diphosphate synthase [Oscillospiraceae bacterium]|nr:flavodoxin-dependent (E)-4-hydroxy-3-methylbut-2-enyl-diphosphate synthase [Oscillospiraceae bacterium]
MTRQIKVGSVAVGGGAPVSVQSMCCTDTRDPAATADQINALAAAGCDIVRVAVPDMTAAKAIAEIKKRIKLPLVADIHFDYKLALAALDGGVDKIRLNPGNVGGEDRVRAVARACETRGVPIRIGVNSGSVEKALLRKYGAPTPEALVESAIGHAKMLENVGFGDICVSVKSSAVPTTVAAYRLMHEKTDYPLHLGVTEAGTEYLGCITSAVGIGTLLMEGIGDTVRVSLTADPLREVPAGIAILKAAGVRRGGVRFVSCPTCGRTEIDLIGLANEVQNRLAGIDKDITVAVMGCVVNGPGEAREADFGIAGGKGEGLIFKKGEIVRKAPYDRLADELIKLIGED